VLCLSAHGQNATTTSTENSLEAARRDLKALPATERSQELLGKSSGLGSAGLPPLSLPSEGSKPQAQPAPNAPPSPTWLQDAMQQTALEQSQRRTSTSPDSSLMRESSSGYKPAPAPDPFGKYLEQWLSPRDLEMLRPESHKNDDQKQNTGGVDQTRSRSGTFGAPASQLSADPVPIMPTAQNPYLVEPASPSTAPLPNPFAPTTPSGLQQNDRNRTPSPLPMPTATSSQRPTAQSKPAAKPAEAVPKAPTAPIIDDQKYFPQLRRF
jgi:hypothetical protein